MALPLPLHQLNRLCLRNMQLLINIESMLRSVFGQIHNSAASDITLRDTVLLTVDL